MQVLLSDLQTKTIVNVIDGRNIGNIIDVKIDNKGLINYLVIEPNKTFFKVFNKEEEMLVKWGDIAKIGEDVILVQTNHETNINNK